MMREKRVENVAGQRRAYAIHNFLASGINFSRQGGAATVGESECVSRQRLNANDFRMLIAEDDTEKLG